MESRGFFNISANLEKKGSAGLSNLWDKIYICWRGQGEEN